MNTLKINIPQGFIIDQEKSTFEEIVFKPIEDEWVDWEDLKKVSGYYIDRCSEICDAERVLANEEGKNVFPTKQDAESALALAQLLQLRKRVIGDWKVDWNDGKVIKYIIRRLKNELYTSHYAILFHEMSFPTAEMRDKFLDKYRNLIEIYFKLK